MNLFRKRKKYPTASPSVSPSPSEYPTASVSASIMYSGTESISASDSWSTSPSESPSPSEEWVRVKKVPIKKAPIIKVTERQICSHCNQRAKDDETYCTHCGAPL